MTIDEAIKHAREVAEDKRADADWKWRNGRLKADDCISCAEEHEQLAEWLEELKERQQSNFDYVQLMDVRYKAGYTKAIDDFAEALKGNVMTITFGARVCDIDRIAEQLKKGDADNE